MYLCISGSLGGRAVVGTHMYRYLLTRATLGRMFMQPKTGESAEMGKNLAADFLCDFGHITLSVTHSSTCRESGISTACLQLPATRRSVCNECQGLSDHRDRQH